MREESPSPCEWSEWQSLVERDFTRGSHQLRLRVDFRSSDGSPANPRLTDLGHLADLLKTEADVTRIIEKKGLLAELIRDVANIFFTRFSVNLAEFGRRFDEAELKAMVGRVKHRGAKETEEEFRRREFRDAKRYWGEDSVRAMPGFAEQARLFDAWLEAGRVPIGVLYKDILAGNHHRELKLHKLSRLLLVKTLEWRSSKEATEPLKPYRGIYGAQLARSAARLLASDFKPEEVPLSSPRDFRW